MIATARPLHTLHTLRTRAVALLLAIAAVAAPLAAPLAAQQSAYDDVSRLDARATAPWGRDAVIYELYVRQFSPEGTFAGVVQRLDSLKSLGVTVLWLMPIHPIGEKMKKGSVGSPYAVRDYMNVNPAYGTKADFKRLVDEAHRRGMRVMIDIVANHTSWDNTLMATPAFYKRDAQGKILSPYDWTDVAALDYGNPALRKYMTDMLVYWVRDFGVDGFRCDVAGEVPTDFWEQARAAVEKVKPDLVMLAEASKPELLVKAFDYDYSWPLYHTIKEVLRDGRSASAIRETWAEERARFPKGALHMRISDDHDEKRAVNFFGERAALAASALVFTLDGVPLLYNGMEIGDPTESAAPALFERLPIFWPFAERRPEFPAFYKALIPLRQQHAALRTGTLTWLGNSDEDRVVTFARRNAEEELLVAINLSNRPFAGTVEAAGSWTEVGPGRDSTRSVGLPALGLEGWGVRVFRRAR